MKTKKCIKCGIRLHATDWIILKEMSTMPICDNCLFSDKVNHESEKVKLNKNPLIKFPEKNY
jgi:hypothetical protein